MEREIAVKKKNDMQFVKKVFKQSKKGLYEDKPDTKEEDENLDESEDAKKAREVIEEAEYLATLSNFHWFIYPFFKTIEVVCDKIFGCKSKAEKFNEERRADLMKQQ